MAIKKLQNNFTTPEQSKRLLELGVPADSADCYYNQIAEKPYFLTMPYSYTNWIDNRNPPLPCWSIGRLIEIMGLCYDFELQSQGAIQIYRTDIENRSVVDVLISDIERFISRLDFSKLEE